MALKLSSPAYPPPPTPVPPCSCRVPFLPSSLITSSQSLNTQSPHQPPGSLIAPHHSYVCLTQLLMCTLSPWSSLDSLMASLCLHLLLTFQELPPCLTSQHVSLRVGSRTAGQTWNGMKEVLGSISCSRGCQEGPTRCICADRIKLEGPKNPQDSGRTALGLEARFGAAGGSGRTHWDSGGNLPASEFLSPQSCCYPTPLRDCPFSHCGSP